MKKNGESEIEKGKKQITNKQKKPQQRCIMSEFPLWRTSAQSCGESSEHLWGIGLRITPPVGIFHSVEDAPRNITLRLLNFANVFENEEERPRSLKCEMSTSSCSCWWIWGSWGSGRQPTASANEVLVMDALHIWFCNKVGEICQTIRINICNVDNKNSSR